jgi:DNA-binding SARP family transcriptional activator/tetratricopeptide (TPR) repeat protein
MPFRLITLGRLALLTPEGREDESLQKRRRKLAVLAVLAMERRAISRDVLVEMFWGGQDEERARHSLSDALSHLRRVLGTGAIELTRHEVRLADGAVVVDAIVLLDAAARGDDEAALDYGGAFLHGVHVAESPGFEHWAERHRRRVEASFRSSCERRCGQLARLRRWDECAELAARWLDVAPLSADAALYRLNALKAAGTPEADRRALDEYERLRARLRRELDLAPEARVTELAASIDARLVGQRNVPAPIVPPAGAAGAERVAARSAADVPPAAPTVPAAAQRRPRSRMLAAAAGVVLLAAAAAAVGVVNARATPAGSEHVLAVIPFDVSGSGDVEFLRTGMVDMLSVNLDGAGELRTVDPRVLLDAIARAGTSPTDPAAAREVARRFGAGLYVLGGVVAAGDRIRVTATLYGPQGQRARAAAEGRSNELFDVVDQLSRQLLAGYPSNSGDRLVNLAAQTTVSLPALRAYLDGTASYRAGRFDAAFDAFERAARTDTTFALAHYQLVHAALWSGRASWDSVASASRRATRHSEQLGRRARLLIEANAAFRGGELDQAERLYGLVVAAYPDDVEAWYQLGDVLFHGNVVRGRLATEARAPFERVLALEPGNFAALTHLARIAAREADGPETAALVARALVGLPADAGSDLRALRAAATGSEREKRRVRDVLAHAEDEQVRVSAERVALFARDSAEARVLATMLRDSRRAPGFRALGAFALADLALARRRADEARSYLAAAESDAPVFAAHRRALFLLHPESRASRDELVAARAALGRVSGKRDPASTLPHFAVYDGLHQAISQYLIGVTSVALGDTAAARVASSALEGMALRAEHGDFAKRLAECVRGHLHASRGELEAAVNAFDRGRLIAPEGMLESAIGNQAYERWVRAEALRALGRRDEARRWYASLGEATFDQLPWAGPAAARLAAMEAAPPEPVGTR